MKQFDLPRNAAKTFMADLRAYHAETDGFKRDEIAARQCFLLREYVPQHGKKLRMRDIKDLFEAMK